MNRLLTILLTLMTFVMGAAIAPSPASSGEAIFISGKIKDAKNKKPLPNSTIAVEGSNIATVSNVDGAFSLHIPDSLGRQCIVISHLGYSNAFVVIAGWHNPGTIMLGKSPTELDEVVVLGGNPREIIKAALDKIYDNYPMTADMMSIFYRETIQKGKRYTEISEGVMEAFKSPYRRRYAGSDRVQVLKGRKLMSQKAADTLAIKVAGGPNLAVVLDFVKNPDFFLDEGDLKYYDFKMEHSVTFDDRRQFVISFRPNTKLEYPLMKGWVYIDAQSLAFTRAEIELDLSDKSKAVNALLRKKPVGLKFNPQSVKYVIAFRQGDDGRTSLSYVMNEMKFKCDWKRRLFSSGYTVVSEMVVVDRKVGIGNTISRKQQFKSYDSFSDMALQYWDADFWKGYNIIEPSESLELAVSRLLKDSRH